MSDVNAALAMVPPARTCDVPSCERPAAWRVVLMPGTGIEDREHACDDPEHVADRMHGLAFTAAEPVNSDLYSAGAEFKIERI